ncbi:hypothetical protein [Pelomonas sp. KK5]|uniref:hypothetical protein n=1 Tax=Pelomonas sp. KK5 TaxID=1855730 RepID=UPI00097CA188|nr:hypothetical protein [Pelomonas sp. KK5]
MIKTLFRLFVLMVFGLLVLSVLGGGFLLHGLDHGITVSMDGDDFTVFDGLGTMIGLLIAGLVLCVVLPLVLLLSVGLPLLIVGCVLAALFGAGALVCSPFVLFVVLMVWLLRGRKENPGRARRRNEPNIVA